MVRTKASLCAAAILSVAFLAVAGCAKKSGPEPSAQAHSGGANAAKTGSLAAGGSGGAGTVRLKPVGAAGSGASKGAPSTSSSPAGGNSAPQGTDRLLASRGGSAVYPLDYEIGALQPELPSGTERGAIVRVVREFFGGLKGGTIETKLLSPQWKDDILRQLAGPKKRGELPESVRIGTVSVDQDRAHAPIRMETGTGSASGEIYLDRVGETWYISDIQASFADLERPPVEGPPFDPAEWKSMVKE